MAERLDVVALGELLIDFAESGNSDQNNVLFEACPGGAPCNVLSMLRFANAAAYLVTTRKGALRSMPDPNEIAKILINDLSLS